MKRIPIVILITALCISIFLCVDKCSSNKEPQIPDIEAVNVATEKAENIDTHFKATVMNLQLKTDSIQKALSNAQHQLIATKIKLQTANKRLFVLTQFDTSNVSKEQQLRDCDSLKVNVKEYVVWVDSTQQRYEDVIDNLKKLTAVKDSELVICHVLYVNLKAISDENLNRERQLTLDLETAYKQQRKKQTQNKALMAGFLILTGITTTFFINSKK